MGGGDMERKTTVCLSYSEDGCDDIGLLCTSVYICPHCGARTSYVTLSSYDFEPDHSWEPGVSTDCSVCNGPVRILPAGPDVAAV